MNLSTRYRWSSALLLAALTFPLVAVGGILAIPTFRNDLVEWLPLDSPDRAEFDAFRGNFGLNDSVFISWPDCTLDSPVLEELVKRLEDDEQRRLYHDVLTGRQAISLLTDEMGIQDEEARGRLVGVLLGPDRESTGMVVGLTEAGGLDRQRSIDRLIEFVVQAGVPAEEIRVAGPAHDLYALDYEGLWSPLRAVPVILLLAFVLSWMFLRRLGSALVVNLLGWYAGLLTVAIVYLTGTPLNAVVWTLPTLVMLLTVSASLHFLGYYRDAVNRNPADAVVAAWRAARGPTLYCALTTAAGLFSLMLSDTAPVREFGLFGGIAVLLSSVIVLGCLPAWLMWRDPLLETRGGAGLIPPSAWRRLAEFTSRRRSWIFGVFLILFAVAAAWIPSLRTSVNIQHLFPADGEVVQQSIWIEEHICPLSSVELMLHFRGANRDNDIERLRRLEALGKRVRGLDEVDGVLSAATFAPALPPFSSSFRGILARRRAMGQVERLKDQLPKFGLLSSEPADEEIWRLSVRVSNVREFDYVRLMEAVQREAEQAFVRDGECVLPLEEFSLTCTGRIPVFHAVERQFLFDLRSTYLSAFLAISVVVLWVMRSLSACLLASLPNLFPAVVVLGFTAWSGMPLDVASLMTASVALGIAVDDTLHFMLWWRAKVLDGMQPREAVNDAMEHCGFAMVQTSVVCGVSVALYGLCGFLPTVRFGLLLSAMLFTALLGDLILLPALLSTKFAQKALLGGRRSAKGADIPSSE